MAKQKYGIIGGMKKKKKCSSSKVQSVMPTTSIDEVARQRSKEANVSDFEIIKKLDFENIPKSLISKLRVEQLLLIYNDIMTEIREYKPIEMPAPLAMRWLGYQMLRVFCLLLDHLTLRILSAKTNIGIDTHSLDGHLTNGYGQILAKRVSNTAVTLDQMSMILSKVYEKNGHAHDKTVAVAIEQYQIVGDTFFSIIISCYPIPQAMAWKNTFGDMIEKLKGGVELGKTAEEYVQCRAEFCNAAQAYVENANRRVNDATAEVAKPKKKRGPHPKCPVKLTAKIWGKSVSTIGHWRAWCRDKEAKNAIKPPDEFPRNDATPEQMELAAAKYSTRICL